MLVAGPCSAESREQVLQCAAALSRMGVHYFRAGVWKPRTRPGGFEGVGAAALEWLREAARTYGLKVGTEVCTAAHARMALQAGLDMVWIGARTSAAPFLVEEIAAELAHFPGTEVLVKNPISPDVSLWQGALERLARAGISNLTAVFRGCTPPLAQEVYRNFPYWEMVGELHKRLPGLPVLCDPSHIAGRAQGVLPVCRTALELGLDGLMVEVHPEPTAALTDAAQQITPQQLQQILTRLQTPAPIGSETTPHPAELRYLRTLLENTDQTLLHLLAQRSRITDRIGLLKKTLGLPAEQPARFKENLERVAQVAQALGLPPEQAQELYQLIHAASVSRQNQIITEP